MKIGKTTIGVNSVKKPAPKWYQKIQKILNYLGTSLVTYGLADNNDTIGFIAIGAMVLGEIINLFTSNE